MMQRRVLVAVVSMALSCCMVVGGVYAAAGTGLGSIGGPAEALGTLLLAVLLGLLLYKPLDALLYGEIPSAGPSSFEGRGIIGRLHDPGALTVVAFLVLLLAWAPYLYTFYPGSVPQDGYKTINFAMGIWPATNQHPALGVILVRLIFSLGRHINDNFGVFLFVALQSLAVAAAFAWSVKSVRELSGSIVLSLICLLYYAITPMWGCYAQTFIKDTLFYAVFLAFFIQLAKMLVPALAKDGADVGAVEWVVLCLFALLACLLRHGETMVILPTLLATAAVASGQRVRFLLSSLAVLVLSVVIGKMLVAYLDAGPILSREIYSIPFQQTARYMREYPDEVSDEEYEAIDAVLAADTIADAYKPLISDDVKITYRPDASRDDMVRYFRVWFEMLLKHPRSYFDAFAQMTSGYLDPLHHVCPHPDYFFWVKGEPTATGDFAIAQVRTKEQQHALISFSGLWLKVPFLAWLEYPGFHTWVVLLCCARLCAAKRFRYVALLACPLLQVLVCIASPVASNIRYALPVMAVTPVAVAWTVWACVHGVAGPSQVGE